jgi:glycosyltransferase involved in cell wall biosynthesis
MARRVVRLDAARPPELVSCVVPAFNAARFLGEALDSILAQTHPAVEVIVVDDGSTDETAAIAAAYASRLRLIRQENRGPAEARNRGLACAQGDYVAFLDADDLWLPDKLARQMARFRARPELDFCVTGIQNFWMDELSEEAARFQGHRFMEVLPGYVLQTLAARRTLFDIVGGFDPARQPSEDVDWFLRALDRGSTHEVLPDLLVRRRLHAGNLTRGDLASRPVLLQAVWASHRRRRGPPSER